jgi:hypothetical protein
MRNFTGATGSSQHKFVYDNVCDGFGCNYKATTQVKVDAGKFGPVTLFLCPNCVGKFADK